MTFKKPENQTVVLAIVAQGPSNCSEMMFLPDFFRIYFVSKYWCGTRKASLEPGFAAVKVA
jgi:hypothetical protein